jgi:hypothetical protein
MPRICLARVGLAPDRGCGFSTTLATYAGGAVAGTVLCVRPEEACE